MFLPGERQKYMTLENESLRSVDVYYATDMNRGQLLITLERMKWLGQSRNDLWKRFVVNVSAGESKDQCCKEHYIGTWNVRPMNEGKLGGQTVGGKSQHQHFRNHWTKMDGNGWI